MLYKQQHAAEWISDELPVDCACQEWNVSSSRASDIKWKTHQFPYTQGSKPILPSCRYAVKIERKQCLVPVNTTSDDIKKCGKLEIKEFRSFYLKKNDCSKKFVNATIEEKCEDNKCLKPYRRIFTPCYYRNISMKTEKSKSLKKNRSLLCRVDWETCNLNLCQYKNEYWEYRVVLGDNCNSSSCSDGISKGVVRYETICSHVSKFQGQFIGNSKACDPRTYQVATVQKLQCPELRSCGSPTTKRNARTKSTRSTITASLFATETPVHDLSSPDVVGLDEIWPDDARYSTAEVVTTTSTTSVAIGTWPGFMIGIVISVCLLIVVMICLTATICRYVVCAREEKNITMHELLRRSRDSLQRGTAMNDV